MLCGSLTLKFHSVFAETGMMKPQVKIMISRAFLMCVFLSLIFLNSPSAFAASIIESAQIRPLPFDVTTGVTIEVSIAESWPGISIEYRWFINDEENLFEKAPHLPGHFFNRGDVIQVEITPVTFAGEHLLPIVSRPFEAMNASPVITSEPPEELTDTGFRYQVTANDPDGDALTFKLENAPENMTINASSGLIQWVFNSMPEGVFPVKIAVDDGYGGLAEQSFELQMAYEKVLP
jgi:hypothetical protein